MPRKRIPQPATKPQATDQDYNPYDTDPYDLLKDPPAAGKSPLHRDDASNDSPQPRPRPS
jgi:hypothetical protein